MDSPNKKIPLKKIFGHACWRTFLWFIFTVVFPVLPLAAVIGFCKITGMGGNEITKAKYIRDIILIAWTITISIIGIVWDDEKNLGLRVRAFFSIIALICTFFCTSHYFSIFGVNISGKDIAEADVPTFLWFAVGVTILHLVLVFIIEIIISYKQSKNLEKSSPPSGPTNREQTIAVNVDSMQPIVATAPKGKE